MIKLIAFGNKDYYSKLAEDLLRRIKIKYPDFVYRTYSDEDLPDSIREYAIKYSRGFGYMTWKPYIVCNELKELSPNDVLIYIDSRSSFTGNKINWLERFINSSEDVGIWEMSNLYGYDHKEYQFTPRELLDFFSAPEQDIVSNQYANTFFCIRVNERTIRIFQEWNNIHKSHPELCRDDNNDDPNNLPGFVENRYDQSTFSLLIKSELRNGLTAMIFTHEDVHHKDSIRIHFWPHQKNKLYYRISQARLMFPWLFRAIRPVYLFWLKRKIRKLRKTS